DVKLPVVLRIGGDIDDRAARIGGQGAERLSQVDAMQNLGAGPDVNQVGIGDPVQLTSVYHGLSPGRASIILAADPSGPHRSQVIERIALVERLVEVLRADQHSAWVNRVQGKGLIIPDVGVVME